MGTEGNNAPPYSLFSSTPIDEKLIFQMRNACHEMEYGGNMAEKTQIAPFAIFFSGNGG